MDDKSLKSKFDKWKKENKQHGRQAFSRFIMLKFLDGLQEISEEFVFKGGNLLWHYIKTPRETIDLDLATINIHSHLEVKQLIEKSLTIHQQIEFEIKKFKELDVNNEVGASVIISFLTNTGQRNQFSIDIVYAIPTDVSRVKSTINKNTHLAASIENIISDKLSAAYRFRSGNTRMKDFDDLWRISKSSTKVNLSKLNAILKEREVPCTLEKEWIEFLEPAWKRHAKSYKDIPKNLSEVFEDINIWLMQKMKK